jgi:tetratricopeptide (TPR) repeat protein
LIEPSEPIVSSAVDAWPEQIGDLLAAGCASEAAVLAAEVAKANPKSFHARVMLADCHRALGDAAAEIAAVEAAVSVKPHRCPIRIRLAKLLLAKGDPAGAVTHLQMVSDSDEHAEPKLLLQLAQLYQQLRRPEEEQAAWIRYVAINPSRARGHDRLAELLLMSGRSREAAPHARQALESNPKKAKYWGLLAAICEDLGELNEAEAAWAKVLELDPASLWAEQHLADLRMRKGLAAPAIASGSAAAFRLNVFGNCQAHVLARCLRQLNPDFHVASTSWAEMVSPQKIQRAADALGQADAVIMQRNLDPRMERLSPDALAARGIKALRFPTLAFTGFHPDALHVSPRAGMRSLIGDWHSTLILAGRQMGLPQRRTAELFNAYIYGVLGYFDEFAHARQFLLAKAWQAGWDSDLDIDAWRASGCFVHTPNHPRIGIMMDVARQVCRKLGVDFDADAAAPPDPFKLAWPVYPEIGKRLGVEGSLTFTTDGDVAFEFEEAIGWYYDVYDQAPPESLRFERVDKTVAVLEAEGV